MASTIKDGNSQHRARRLAAGRLHEAEHIMYAAVAFALVAAAVALFGWSLYDFARSLSRSVTFERAILDLLDALLLVFIVTELIHTLRAVIDQNLLIAEPFLIVGIVAAVRRVIVITGETPTELGTAGFRDLLAEILVLSGVVLVLGTVIFLLRHTSKSEPRPAHEPGPDPVDPDEAAAP